MVFLHYKKTFYLVLQHRPMADTKLTLSRLQKTVVMKYERHAPYERINSKTEKHEKTEKTVRDNIVRITGCFLLAY